MAKIVLEQGPSATTPDPNELALYAKTDKRLYIKDDAGVETPIAGAVQGPVSATDNAITRFDGTSGSLIQNSSASIDDSGNITATNLSGSSSGTNTGDVSLASVGSSPNSNAASLAGQVLTLQPADATNPGVLTTGTQSIAGTKTFTGSVSASNLSGTNSGDVSLTAVGSSPNANAASLSGQALTLQPADGSNPGVVTAGSQTIAGTKTFTGTISASNLSGTNTGDVTLAAVGASPNSNGASLSGQVLTLQPADASNPGILTNTTQTIPGNKLFGGTLSNDKAFYSKITTLTDAATIATDASLASTFTVTLGGNRTLGNPTNSIDGQKIIWRIKQDGTGSRTITLDSNFRLGADISSVTLSTTASKTDYIGAIYNSSDSKWDIIAFVKGY